MLKFYLIFFAFTFSLANAAALCDTNRTAECRGVGVTCVNGYALDQSYECSSIQQACSMPTYEKQYQAWYISEDVCVCDKGYTGIDCSLVAGGKNATDNICPGTQVFDGTFFNLAAAEQKFECTVDYDLDDPGSLGLLGLFMMNDHKFTITQTRRDIQSNSSSIIADLSVVATSRLLNFSASHPVECANGCTPGVNCDQCTCTRAQEIITCQFNGCLGRMLEDDDGIPYVEYDQCNDLSCSACTLEGTQCGLYEILQGLEDMAIRYYDINETQGHAKAFMRLAMAAGLTTDFPMSCGAGVCSDRIEQRIVEYEEIKIEFESVASVITISIAIVGFSIPLAFCIFATRILNNGAEVRQAKKDAKAAAAKNKVHPDSEPKLNYIHRAKLKVQQQTAALDDFYDDLPEDDPTAIKTTIGFNDISYKIGDVQIIEGLTGYVRSGESVAIIGPSGSGKTTLLELIVGERGAATYDGKIQMSYEENKPIQLGYVQQFDLLMATQSVFESVFFSARLRLGDEVSDAECEKKVDVILERLNIFHLKERLIGDPEVGGLSGGERRRVSLALEMVADPAMLLLDEPTTGLDSLAAFNLIKLFQLLSKKQRLGILFTVHQMSSHFLNHLDKVMVVAANGRLGYFGPAGELVERTKPNPKQELPPPAMDYGGFGGAASSEKKGSSPRKSQTLEEPVDTSPAKSTKELDSVAAIDGVDESPASFAAAAETDLNVEDLTSEAGDKTDEPLPPPGSPPEAKTVIEIVNGVKRVRRTGDKGGAKAKKKFFGLVEYMASVELPVPENTNPADHVLQFAQSQPDVLTRKFEDSKIGATLLYDLWEQVHMAQSSSKGVVAEIDRQANKGCSAVMKQIKMLFIREFRNYSRAPATIFIHNFVCSILGILLGIVFYDLDDGIAGTQNRLGVLFFFTIYFTMTSMSALPVFVADRRRFWRETSSTYYTTFPYAFSKMFTDVILLRTVAPFLFSLFVYWMIGFQDSNDRFLIFCILLFVINVTATFFCMLVSASAKTQQQANFFGVIIIMFFLIFGGLFLNLGSNDGIMVVSYFSFFRWGYEALVINEFEGLTFTFAPDEIDVRVQMEGRVLVDNVGMDVDNFQLDIVMLFAYCAFFFVATLVALAFLNENPKKSISSKGCCSNSTKPAQKPKQTSDE